MDVALPATTQLHLGKCLVLSGSTIVFLGHFLRDLAERDYLHNISKRLQKSLLVSLSKSRSLLPLIWVCRVLHVTKFYCPCLHHLYEDPFRGGVQNSRMRDLLLSKNQDFILFGAILQEYPI